MFTITCITSNICITMTKLRMIDAFAGIGGMSYALSDVAKTVGYIEIDDTCQLILRKNMGRGLIDRAPIFNDITKLKPGDISKLNSNFITAGFPCQDLSSAGKQEGIGGSRSNLYKYVLHICNHIPSIKCALFENSNQMMKPSNISKFLRDLQQCGFGYVSYGVFSAHEVGALHRRLRWFCMASKDQSIVEKIKLCKELQFKSWHSKEEPYERLVPRPQRDPYMRHRVLGNSVVPQQVRYAFNSLLQGLKTSCTSNGVLDHSHKISLHNHIIINQNGLKYLINKIPTRMKQQQQTMSATIRDAVNNFVRHVTWWPTPAVSSPQSGRKLTNRGTTILSNRIMYDTKTKVPPDVSRRNDITTKYTTNPCFIEWLLGYPYNYTKI